MGEDGGAFKPMNKKTTLILLLIAVNVIVMAQQTFISKVPKQYSFEFGYRNLFAQSNFVNQSTHGYGMLFDYAWQLSGLDGKKSPVYLSVPLGYTVLMPDNPESKSVHMLNYGWTVRHDLSRGHKWTPFVAYGLLLNNMRITDTEGSLFGHQTQFDLGVNMNTSGRLKYYAKIEYSYTSYPRFNESERIRLHYADLRIGVRF